MQHPYLLVLLLAMASFSGCATFSNNQKHEYAPPPAVRKAPSVNLNGFPAAYKAGYVDACGNARDYKRFKSDPQYKQGWSDGKSICQASSKSRTTWAGSN